MDEDLLKPIKIKEFSSLLNVSVKTLQRWDNTGILKAYRTPTNRRYYTYEQYLNIIKQNENNLKNVILYSRVLDENQIDDLNKQEKILTKYCINHNYKITYSFKDVGSGACIQRKEFQNFIDKIKSDKIDAVIILSEDRLTLFYFSLFEEYFNKYGTKIIALRKNTLTQIDVLKEASKVYTK